ncbi:hypothetical protein [Burkholderia ambifaria]|uniref:hypothetical protein n=1 Tax=Burkholderia ambifaria TaxID=152480 RepID=UPI0012FDB043|nr:hypothetical protein [Burkholderia ambifaria]
MKIGEEENRNGADSTGTAARAGFGADAPAEPPFRPVRTSSLRAPMCGLRIATS